MDIKAFLLGLGFVALVTLILFPEIKSMRETPQAHAERRSFEQQARQAQDVTATEEDEHEERRQDRQSDEEISARKGYQDYRPPDAWRWKYEAEEQVVCEYIPEWDDVVCHTIFERPMAYPPGYRPRSHADSMLKPRHRKRERVIQTGPVIHARVPCNGGCPYPGG